MSSPGLRPRILGALLLVAVGGIASVGMIAIWRTRQAIAEDRLERAASVMATGRTLFERSMEQGQTMAEAAPVIARAMGATELAVLTADGGLWPTHARPLETDSAGRAAAAAGMRPHARILSDRAGIVVLYAPLEPGGRKLGIMRATFAIDDTVDASLAETRATVLILGALNGLVLVAAAAWILRAAVVRPVLDLEHAVRRVADGDLTAAVAVRGPGELGRLAAGFDRMTASLRAGRDSLIRSEKLASVGRLAAGVAHEVGNPLAAILGYVEVLLTENPAKPIDSALRQDMLQRVRTETERIHRIIQELLDYSRPPRDEPEAVDVRRVVSAAVSLTNAQARGRDVDIDVRIPDDLSPVLATTGRLTQVMLNLLLNASDAMGGRGRVTIEACRRNGRVIISVADEGPGIALEARGRIFDPFFTTKEPGHGTGLGLAVCQAIVETYGGTIRLAHSDHGAKFEIELVVADGAALTAA